MKPIEALTDGEEFVKMERGDWGDLGQGENARKRRKMACGKLRSGMIRKVQLRALMKLNLDAMIVIAFP